MKYAGVDLHKKTLTVCVVRQDRSVVVSRRLKCAEPERIVEFFEELGEFEVVVEATASYEWFIQLVEPLAERVVLAHPGKMKVIAESKRKTDKFDARMLARQLALDEVPEAHRPTARQRAHRRLVRQRCFLQKRIGGVKSKMRRIMSDYNADFPALFNTPLQEALEGVPISESDRFVLEQLDEELALYGRQLQQMDKRIQEFARQAPAAEQAQREILKSIPQVATVTTEVVLAELAGPERFGSQKKAVAYAGLAPGQRESAGKRKELHIEKSGSPLLRWVLIEAAWRLVGNEPSWGVLFEDLRRRKGKKKAIVAIARRLLCLMIGLLDRGETYDGRRVLATARNVIERANPDLRVA